MHIVESPVCTFEGTASSKAFSGRTCMASLRDILKSVLDMH